MLGPEQLQVLAALAGRDLTAADLAQLEPLVAIRNDVAIAAHLSIGRKKLERVSEGVGCGTVLALMTPRGGAFLDEVQKRGETDRELYWGMEPIRRGVFDPGLPAGQVYLDKLAIDIPGFEAELERIKALGFVDAPLHFSEVSTALNRVEGRATL